MILIPFFVVVGMCFFLTWFLDYCQFTDHESIIVTLSKVRT